MPAPEEFQKNFFGESRKSYSAVSSEIPVDVVIEAKEESKVEVPVEDAAQQQADATEPLLVDQIPDPPTPNPESINVGAAPTGIVTAAAVEAVGTVPSTENVVMDENPKAIKIDAAVPSEKPVDAVMSNALAEFVSVNQCLQDGKIHVDLTLPDWDDVFDDEDIMVLTP